MQFFVILLAMLVGLWAAALVSSVVLSYYRQRHPGAMGWIPLLLHFLLFVLMAASFAAGVAYLAYRLGMLAA